METTYINDFDKGKRWKVLEKEYKLFTGEKHQENNFLLIQNLFFISYFKSSLSNHAKLPQKTTDFYDDVHAKKNLWTHFSYTPFHTNYL